MNALNKSQCITFLFTEEKIERDSFATIFELWFFFNKKSNVWLSLGKINSSRHKRWHSLWIFYDDVKRWFNDSFQWGGGSLLLNCMFLWLTLSHGFLTSSCQSSANLTQGGFLAVGCPCELVDGGTFPTVSLPVSRESRKTFLR